MIKNIGKRIKLISLLTCICIFITQAFLGCNESDSLPKNSRLQIQSDSTNYIADNFDEYKDKIKEETGLDGKIVSVDEDGKEQKYIEFNIDDTTKIKFHVNHTIVIITKQFEPSGEFNYKREVEMNLFGMKEDANVRIALKQNGSISCDYKANDLEHPLPSQKEKDECIDAQIKAVTSTEELKELTSKAHSIYNVFEEICNEYNESLKNESK